MAIVFVAVLIAMVSAVLAGAPRSIAEDHAQIV